MNRPPAGFDPAADLPPGFVDFYSPLHRRFTPRQQEACAARARVLSDALSGRLPQHLPPSEATRDAWRIALPSWCQDQRNQMTGPADDGELVVKMLNSGAPGVMLDLEDSTANLWPHLLAGYENISKALRGELTYFDKKRQTTIGIQPSSTVIWNRVRGLHLSQLGIVRHDPSGDEPTSASLFDLCMLAYRVEPKALKHPFAIYIPKSESADEAVWWREVMQAVAVARGWPKDAIKCMALVESHPLAYQIEEFSYQLRDHLVGLNLGRWDYMASLIHFNLANPAWMLPDRNTIPHDVAFFQRLRELLVELCHKHGILAIGGMTALYPSREDPALNARALSALARDKKNEALALMDGAWTGHPDQNAIAVEQFPVPNQVHARRQDVERYPDLRPVPKGVGTHSEEGTRAAVRTAIRYRQGALAGKGASLLDGYMEDLATDRIYRLMIAQRVRHGMHSAAEITRFFDEELRRVLDVLPSDAGDEARERFRLARKLTEEAVVRAEFDPV